MQCDYSKPRKFGITCTLIDRWILPTHLKGKLQLELVVSVQRFQFIISKGEICFTPGVLWNDKPYVYKWSAWNRNDCFYSSCSKWNAADKWISFPARFGKPYLTDASILSRKAFQNMHKLCPSLQPYVLPCSKMSHQIPTVKEGMFA